MPDKEAETTREAYSRLYPGNRFDERKKAFQLLSVDGGNEFSGTFGKEVRRRGTQLRISLPRRSETNAVAERAVRDWQRDTTAALLHAGAALNFWSLAGEHADHNNFISLPVIDGKTGYEVEYGKAYEGVAVPWGCAATYLADDVDKVEPRGRAGVVVGCAQDGAFRVMDLESYKCDRTYKEVTSRDVQVDRSLFPLRLVLTDEERMNPTNVLVEEEDDAAVQGALGTYTDPAMPVPGVQEAGHGCTGNLPLLSRRRRSS